MESGRARSPEDQALEPPQPPEPSTPASEPGATSGAGNVEQIRDILFGAQMRDYERRFSSLEARLTHEAAMLRQDIQTRFDALEAEVRQQFSALAESIGHEREHRTGAVQTMSEDLRVLRDAAADRRALAELLTEMARRLANGTKPPDAP